MFIAGLNFEERPLLWFFILVVGLPLIIAIPPLLFRRAKQIRIEREAASRTTTKPDGIPRPTTVLSMDETLIRWGVANMQRGWEAVGGRLYLTNQRLIFESYRYNIQTGTSILPIPEIVSIARCWTKFLGVIPLAANSIEVGIQGGRIEKFVVLCRDEWIAAIQQAMGK